MSSRYRADIDGLRAIAVTLVVAFHAFPGIVPGGFTGVDVFFVISGYLITGILFKDSRLSISPIAFYIRRVNRIFPALIIVLGTSLVAGWFLLFPDEYRLLGKHVRSAASFIVNFVYFGETGYFDARSEEKPLLHLWSLAVEEQFYLIWPLFFWGVVRTKISPRKATIAFALASFTANAAIAWQNPSADFFLPVFRFWELAAGAAAALYPSSETQSARRLRLTAFRPLAGITLILAGAAFAPPAGPYPGLWALLPVSGAVLIVLGAPQESLSARLLSSPFMVGVGLISYPLYLWHWPLLSFGRIVSGNTLTDLAALGLLAIAICLSVLTYLVIERPFRLQRGRSAYAVGLAACLLLVGATGVLVEETRGKLGRGIEMAYPITAERFTAVQKTPCAPEVSTRYQLDLCVYPPGESPPTVMFYGDSHAWRLFDAMQRILGPEHVAFAGHTGSGLEDADATGLMILNRGQNSIDIITNSPSSIKPETLKERILALLAARHQIILVQDNPKLARNVSECMGRPLKPEWLKQACDTDIDTQLRRLEPQAQLFEMLKSDFPSQVTVIGTLDLFCSDNRCSYNDRKTGFLDYDTDSEHLNLTGARKVAERVFAEIKKKRISK